MANKIIMWTKYGWEQVSKDSYYYNSWSGKLCDFFHRAEDVIPTVLCALLGIGTIIFTILSIIEILK
jgi:hypothetical protein